jgi:rhodanese-related sulfurtransferase
MPELIGSISKYIELEDVKQSLETHRVMQIIDVRDKDEYEQRHTPRALHIPVQELRAATAYLDKTVQYIVV